MSLLYPYEAENAVRQEAKKRGHAIQAPTFNQEKVPISGTNFSVFCPIGQIRRNFMDEIMAKYPERRVM